MLKWHSQIAKVEGICDVYSIGSLLDSHIQNTEWSNNTVDKRGEKISI